MSRYLENRDDAALDLLIQRLEAAESLTENQQDALREAQSILATRSAAKVGVVFDIPLAIASLTAMARERRLCSYKELADACINDPSAEWNRYYRQIGGQHGLMQSIIRHCAARELPPLSALVVRQGEVAAGPMIAPNRDGEAAYGFTRGMVDDGLAPPSVDTDQLTLESRQRCFDWARRE